MLEDVLLNPSISSEMTDILPLLTNINDLVTIITYSVLAIALVLFCYVMYFFLRDLMKG